MYIYFFLHLFNFVTAAAEAAAKETASGEASAAEDAAAVVTT
jgi:hypothetical protein